MLSANAGLFVSKKGKLSTSSKIEITEKLIIYFVRPNESIETE